MENWSIELWVTEDGVCRVDKDLLKKLRNKEKFLFKSLEEKMRQYTSAKIADVQHQKDLEKVKNEVDMWELKFHLSKNEIRFLGYMDLQKEFSVFYALYAFKKKNQEIMEKHKIAARNRVKEFTNYFNRNGL
ncbi:MAG: type II toxin-antitoxin system RelE/ParE family toxin [Patescibacteria group bacterium]